jgi:hypothetical protein
MKMKKPIRYTIAIILIIAMIALGATTFLKYHVKPLESYRLDSQNMINDGGFENFSDKVGDCCNAHSDQSKVFATESTDAFKGQFSLNLTSYSQCACINKPFNQLNNMLEYFLSFEYKGDNPHFCNFVKGDDNCLPNLKIPQNKSWTEYHTILSFTNKSQSASIYLYADSSGTPVTNLYDSLEVHRLIPMNTSASNYYNPNSQYIIKTNPDNLVDGEMLNDQGYYLVTGEPNITLRFPWSELIILLVMMIIVIRLLFKNPASEIEKDVEKELKRFKK